MASRKVLSLILLCTFSISCYYWADGASQSPASAPGPSSVDCTNLIISMADCLSFVSNGSATTKPEGNCCSGLKTVLSTKAECLCEAFKTSAQAGIVLNVTKALSLPSVCKIHAPPASNCGLLALSPSGAPAPAPGGSAPGPAVSGGGNEQAPAPSPDGASQSPASAPGPSSVDCTNLIISMADCLSFVSNGSATTKPEGNCCSGLKTVLSTKAECLCEAFKTSAQAGIVLNVTKALSLPSVCKIHAPPASNCGLLALSPSGAPAPAPGGSAPGPAVSGGGNEQAPAPSPDGASQSPASAPGPSSVDCTNLIISMADCLSFVSNGSATTKPEGNCCSGLKTVLSTKAECLCEAFKTSAQAGIVLNVTKALSLPSVCKIHAPPASNCGLLALSPSGAPAPAPGGSAPGPAVSGGGNEQAPAPSPDGASQSPASAPGPSSVDCTNLIISMADCLSFVSNGSATTKPEGNCCSGLKTVLSTKAECLCEAFKTSAQAGIVLNVTKALSLPSVCKIHAPPASNCGLLALSPSGAPAPAPGGSAPGPAVSGGGNEQAPAPSPDGASQSPASAPGPSSVDCTNLIISMADCLSFVSNGSATTKPEGNCCSGLKTVLSTKAECLCEAFKTSAQVGIVLNVTKALSLPSVCKIHAPPASNCGLLALSPSGAPAPAPGGSAPGPAVSGGGNEQAPAPSPDGASQSPASAPGPSSVDCTNLIISMADCLSFVSNGSATTKPEGNCCSGLKTVLSTKAECLCEAFKTSAQAGIVLNVTKALSLPSVCKIHAPPASNCGLLALSPSGAPAPAPGGSAPGPAVSGGGNEQAPAPSPDGASQSPASAPGPSSVDCTNLIISMADCLSFVSNGSATTKPEGNCCSGLKTVLSTKAECLCEAFKTSAQAGIVLNVTKALSPPSVCKIHAPPASNCGLLALSPSGAPAPAPGGSAPGPAVSGGGNEQAPAPSPDGASQSPASAPGPSSVDCTNLIISMADCLSFVSNGSATTKPEGNCCSGLKTVLSTKAECLCEAFKTSAQAGIVLNVTKALSLPSVCKIHAPPASNCGLLALSPSGAPAPAPGGSAPGPAVSGGGNEQAPAPSPDGASQSPASAPGPSSVDCTNLIISMADCLSFVSNGSATTKPEGNCCSGLKTVLSTKAECLCEAFKTSAQAGIVLNVTKALSPPSVCKIHAPPASNCGLLALSPSGAPAPAPGGSAPGPAVSGGGNEQAPAPSPDGASQSPASAPGPSSVDCTNLIISMADCLSFVSNGSATTKPEGNCCSGLKTVLSTKAECLCEAFKTSAQAGIVLNVTKALSLPSVCKIHAPPASNCGLLALSPSGAPAPAPGGSAPGPAVSGGGNEQAPAPSPGHSGSIGFSISVGSLIIGFVVPSFFSF